MRRRNKVLAFLLSLVMTTAFLPAQTRIRAGELPMETTTEGSTQEIQEEAAAPGGAAEEIPGAGGEAEQDSSGSSAEQHMETAGTTMEQGTEPTGTSADQSTGSSGASTEQSMGSSGVSMEQSTETAGSISEQFTESGTEPAEQETGADQEGTEQESSEQESETEDAAYPAQIFTETSAGGASVTAQAEQGVFPAGTTMEIEDVDASLAVEKAQEALGSEVEIMDAAGVNITFYDAQHQEVQPKDNSRVQIRLDWGSAVEGENFSVVHVQHDGTAEVVEDIDSISETGAAFEAESFSIYLSAGYSLSSNSSSAVVYLDDTITLNSTNNRSSGTWSSSNSAVASVTKNSDGSASVTGRRVGTATITYRSGNGGRETFSITVMNPVITAAVYVAGSDLNGNRFSSEMLDLLNVSTLDGMGYYAAGTLQVDLRELSGNSSSLIRTEADVAYITNQLQHLKTSDSLSDPDNRIGNYISQVQWGSDLGSSQGHMYSGMWVSSGSSNISTATPVNTGGVPTSGETHTWHLDLRFETVHINYLYGHNGITSGTTADGSAAGSKVFIRDSQMDYLPEITPPEGYSIAGYFEDPDFTTPWTGYNEPIHEDQTVYIKLQALPGITEDGYLIVRKTFAGLTQEQIPSGFVLSVSGNELRTTNANSAVVSDEGITYTWKVDRIADRSFTVSEQGETADGYDAESSVPESGNIEVQAADIGVRTASGQADSGTWTVAANGEDSIFFAAAIKGRTVIITKDNLSISQRLAVQDWVQNSLSGFPAEYSWYNLEGRSSAAFSIESETGGTANVTYANGQLTFPSANVWSAAAAGAYSIPKAAQSTDIAVTNTYTRSTMDLTVTKKVTGNMGDKSKKFTFHAVDLDGSQTTFTLSDGESFTLTGIRIGSLITMTEENAAGYDTEVKYGSTQDGTFRGGTIRETNGSYSFTVEKENDQVLVTNHKSTVPDTGILLDTAPYALILLCLALTAAAAALLAKLRRRRSL